MRRLIANCFVGLMAVCLVAYAQAAKKPNPQSLENGKYDFKLHVPEMAEGKKDLTLPAELEIAKEKLLIKTQGMMGNKIALNGILQKGDLKVGMTATERENIISFHYIGKVVTATEAKGKLYCFINGKAAFEGDWVLTKNNGEDRENTEDQ